MEWTLGQKVVVVEYRTQRPVVSEAEIVKIGRKWVTAKRLHHEMRFDHHGVGDTDFGYKPRLWPSLEAYEASERRNNQWQALRSAVDRRWRPPEYLTTEQIEVMIATLADPTPPV